MCKTANDKRMVSVFFSFAENRALNPIRIVYKTLIFEEKRIIKAYFEVSSVGSNTKCDFERPACTAGQGPDLVWRRHNSPLSLSGLLQQITLTMLFVLAQLSTKCSR